MHEQQPVVYCWGCSKLILVPYLDESKIAELFKCGWCGAVNDLQQQPLHCVPSQGLSQSHDQHVQPRGYNHNSKEQCSSLDYYTQQQQHWQQQQTGQPSTLSSSWKQPDSSSNSSKITSSWQLARHSCAKACCAALRWLMVVFVLLLVFSITSCGIIVVLPVVCTTWNTYLPNLVLSLLLVFEVLSNYAAAVMLPAGRVQDFATLPHKTLDGYIPQGSLQHWSWCKYCQSAKPPSAHHCRTCNACVMHMDHHCPLLNNCVGQSNLRSFLLFLFWTLLSAAYMLFMCSLLTWQRWGEVKALAVAGYRGDTRVLQHDAWESSSPAVAGLAGVSSDAAATVAATPNSTGAAVSQSLLPLGPGPWVSAATGVFVLLLQESPWWMLAAYYLVAVSLGMLVALGLLMGSQLYYLGQGVSYIDHLKLMQSHGQQQQAFVTGQEGRASFGGRVRNTWLKWWQVVCGPCLQRTTCNMCWALLVPWHATLSGNKKWS